jgi:hypothetical protein
MDGPVPFVALVLLLTASALLLGLLVATAKAIFPGANSTARWPFRVAVVCATVTVPMFVLSALSSSTVIGHVPMYLTIAFAVWAVVVAVQLNKNTKR